jgi:predicted RNase H-like nuclease (RuvC/YqgF family)
MDFVGYSTKLRSIDRDLEKAQADVGRQQPARTEVRNFNSALPDYIKRLRASIGALDGICTKLASKAQNPERYSSKEYAADLDRYEKLRREYSEAGTKLNDLFRRMQG